jgi:anti-sigma factor RsiW
MDMKITQNIVEDLLPVYLAGEASTDTRALLEEYQREHPEFAQRVREAAARANALLDAPLEATSPDREKAALECARKRMRFRSQMLGFCIGYGLMPFAFVFDKGHLTWLMVRDNPTAAIAFWVASAACAVGAWFVGRRTTAGA